MPSFLNVQSSFREHVLRSAHSLHSVRPAGRIINPLICLVSVSMLCLLFCSGCATEPTDEDGLLGNTYIELVDWHIAGFWVINVPVAWVRVKNNNSVPIKDLVLRYRTYAADGTVLNEGTYTLDDTIGAGKVKNFFGEYLGYVDLYTDKLSVDLCKVSGTNGVHSLAENAAGRI
jgi:hypothetical protein